MNKNRVIQLNITDELGTHTLQEIDFVVKCRSCGTERQLLKRDLKGNNIRPCRCKCGGDNEFRYWLDRIYTEQEYETLERQAVNRREGCK